MPDNTDEISQPPNSRDDAEEEEAKSVALQPLPTMPGRNGGTLRRGSPTLEQQKNRSPKRIREAARKMLLQSNTGGLAFIKELLKTGNISQKMWASEQLLKYGVGAANVTLDNEGNAMANTLNIVEREEGVTGEERDVADDTGS